MYRSRTAEYALHRQAHHRVRDDEKLREDRADASYASRHAAEMVFGLRGSTAPSLVEIAAPGRPAVRLEGTPGAKTLVWRLPEKR